MTYEEIADSLILKYKLNTLLKPLTGVPARDLILILLQTASMKEAALCMDIAEERLESYLRRHLKPVFSTKTTKHKWSSHLLLCLDLRYCVSCKKVLSYDCFCIDNNNVLGVSRMCKECDKTKAKEYRINNLDKCRETVRNHYLNNKDYYLNKNAMYRAKLGQACPGWADKEKISGIYSNVPAGMHVDHIYPLNSDWVCGLHVHQNLQYLSPEDNLRKSNFYNPIIH